MKLIPLLFLLWAGLVHSVSPTSGFDAVFGYWMYRIDYEISGADHALAKGCRTSGQMPCDFHDFVKQIENIDAESNYSPTVGRTHIADHMDPQLAEVADMGYWDGDWGDQNEQHRKTGEVGKWWEEGREWITGFTAISFEKFLGENMTSTTVEQYLAQNNRFGMRGFYSVNVNWLLSFMSQASASDDQGLKSRVSDMATRARDAIKVAVAGRVMEYGSERKEGFLNSIYRNLGRKVDLVEKKATRWIDGQALDLVWNGQEVMEPDWRSTIGFTSPPEKPDPAWRHTVAGFINDWIRSNQNDGYGGSDGHLRLVDLMQEKMMEIRNKQRCLAPHS